jgi:uncharacterized membrane protein YdjX (TVP38/TMEM64 family)
MVYAFGNRKMWGSVLGIVAIGILFIAVALFANTYQYEIQSVVVHDGSIGMILYVLVTAFATVVAPVSALPLIPLAVSMWGWIVTGILSVIGWVIGSQIAFFIARKYGKTVIEKIISLEKIEDFEKHFSAKNIFWTVVFLRMTVPVDILSYALGLFSTMSSTSYFLATVIGVIPFAFIFSYAGSLPPGLQVMTFIEIFFVLALVYVLKKKLR